MKKTRRILLALYLILAGILAFGVGIPFLNYVVGALGIAAGVLFLLERK